MDWGTFLIGVACGGALVASSMTIWFMHRNDEQDERELKRRYFEEE